MAIKRLLTSIALIILIPALPQVALSYTDNELDYSDEKITLDIRANGDWYLNLDGNKYVFERHPRGLMKVYGPDVCYWLYPTEEGLMEADCNLKSISILVSSFKI
jgi:hypothetical protein